MKVRVRDQNSWKELPIQKPLTAGKDYQKPLIAGKGIGINDRYQIRSTYGEGVPQLVLSCDTSVLTDVEVTSSEMFCTARAQTYGNNSNFILFFSPITYFQPPAGSILSLNGNGIQANIKMVDKTILESALPEGYTPLNLFREESNENATDEPGVDGTYFLAVYSYNNTPWLWGIIPNTFFGATIEVKGSKYIQVPLSGVPVVGLEDSGPADMQLIKSYVNGRFCESVIEESVRFKDASSDIYSTCVSLGLGTSVLTSYQAAIGTYNNPDLLSSFFVGNGASGSPSNAFRVKKDGKCYSGDSFIDSGADYAEFFEWHDENPNREDRRGHFVSLNGDKLIYATSSNDYIVGVITGNPGVIGNAASEGWRGKYLTDIYGTYIYETVYVNEQKDFLGNILVPAHYTKNLILNPDYDPTIPYIPREQRSEWAQVGMMGQIVVIDDGTCQVNGYCQPTTGGIATSAIVGGQGRYRVMKRLDENHILILFK